MADVSNGQQAAFFSWGLTITTVAVPEPSSLALGILGALALLGEPGEFAVNSCPEGVVKGTRNERGPPRAV